MEEKREDVISVHLKEVFFTNNLPVLGYMMSIRRQEVGNISVSFFWKDEKFRKTCKVTSAGWCWLEKNGLKEGNVTEQVSRNRGYARSVKCN